MSTIEKDKRLKVLKAFRVANLNWGVAKRAKDTLAMNRFNGQLKENIIKARELGFRIWVNDNGRTGHTYEKDYRRSNVADNDFEEHVRLINIQLKENIEKKKFIPGDE